MRCQNFGGDDVARQVLSAQFSDFLRATLDRCAAGEIIVTTDGRERRVPGVPDATYMASFDPFDPNGVRGYAGYHGVRSSWAPAFRDQDGTLDPTLLAWCAGGRQAGPGPARRGAA